MNTCNVKGSIYICLQSIYQPKFVHLCGEMGSADSLDSPFTKGWTHYLVHYVVSSKGILT